MKTYDVIQSYMVTDIYKNIKADSEEEAILKIGEENCFVDESIHEDTTTEVKLIEGRFQEGYYEEKGLC